MSKLIRTLGFLWLVLAIAVAQPPSDTNSPVLDTTGQQLQSGVEYYILPDTNRTGGDAGGGLTLIDRKDACPLYAGQEDLANSTGFPVIFTPFFAGETVIREFRDFKIYFSALTICVQLTSWNLGEKNRATNTTLIVTGGDGSYFRVERYGEGYTLGWCPTDVCPLCRFACGSLGVVVEDGKKLLALYAPALPVVFKRA